MQRSFKLILILLVSFFVQSKEQFVIPQSLLNQVEKGNAEAAYFIADMFYNGSDDYNENKEKAIIWYEKAALMGNPHAMLAIAESFDKEDKKVQAYAWYKKASDQGMGEAMDMIASYYYNGYANLEKNCKTANKWYEKAQAKGVEMAFNNHAWILATSKDKSCRNPERALKIIYDLFATYKSEDKIPWHVWDTKAAVLAAVSDFGEAIKLQKWLLEKLKNFNIDTKNYQLHLDSYIQRKPWVM